jgi:hypothetical protein
LDWFFSAFDWIESHYSIKILIFLITWWWWVRFKTTRIYSIFIIYTNRKKLLRHKLFYILAQVPLIETEIYCIGRKEVFGHLLFYESALFSDFIKNLILNITEGEKTSNYNSIISRLKFINYYNNFKFTNQSLSQYILDEFDKLIVSYRDTLLYLTYQNIDITHSDKIKYSKNKDNLDLINNDSIVKEIQLQKMKVVLSKYDEIMFPHRNQIKKNIQTFFSSDIRVDNLLDGILSHCFFSVYKNISETIAIEINKINGEFKNISYGGYKL